MSAQSVLSRLMALVAMVGLAVGLSASYRCRVMAHTVATSGLSAKCARRDPEGAVQHGEFLEIDSAAVASARLIASHEPTVSRPSNRNAQERADSPLSSRAQGSDRAERAEGREADVAADEESDEEAPRGSQRKQRAQVPRTRAACGDNEEKTGMVTESKTTKLRDRVRETTARLLRSDMISAHRYHDSRL